MQGSSVFSVSPCKVVRASCCVLVVRPSRISVLPNLTTTTRPWKPSSIGMMGGGPRTYPGGVTKWQWKRMQAKKTRQLEKARMLRERQVYEMRRRAELVAATPELEIPWQKISRFPTATAITADQQIKKMAGIFDKKEAEDLWSGADCKPSIRLFPASAVRNTQLYRRHTSSKPAPLLDSHQTNAGKSLEADEEESRLEKNPSVRLFPPTAVHSTQLYRSHTSSKPAPLLDSHQNNAGKSLEADEEESRLEKNPSSHVRKPPQVLSSLLPTLEDRSQLDFSVRRHPRSANVKQEFM